MRYASVVLALAAAATYAGAADTFRSGPERVALIELYTSEGCSSCPPAERWLGLLRDDGRLWREFVPVAFHVNYWDYIGWKDRFASPQFTDRQRAIARSWRSDSVYTPCFVRNGDEWRSRDLDRNDATIVGTLEANYRSDGQVDVSFRPGANTAESYDVFVSLLGGGITSDVKRGENSGRKLAHEFVALNLAKSVLRGGGDGSLSATVSLPPGEVPVTPRRGLAVWVTRHGDLAPIQATGGWLE